MVAPDCASHGLSEDKTALRGPEGFRGFYALYRGAFPDMHITVEDVICDGERVAARFSGSATHAGDTLGVPATSRRVTFSGMSFTTWKDGRMTEAWNCVDMTDLLRQIGAA